MVHLAVCAAHASLTLREAVWLWCSYRPSRLFEGPLCTSEAQATPQTKKKSLKSSVKGCGGSSGSDALPLRLDEPQFVRLAMWL
jgi:hypothetical protein